MNNCKSITMQKWQSQDGSGYLGKFLLSANGFALNTAVLVNPLIMKFLHIKKTCTFVGFSTCLPTTVFELWKSRIHITSNNKIIYTVFSFIGISHIKTSTCRYVKQRSFIIVFQVYFKLTQVTRSYKSSKCPRNELIQTYRNPIYTKLCQAFEFYTK